MARSSSTQISDGLSRFFKPSNDLTIELLQAGIENANEVYVPSKKKLVKTLFSLLHAAIKDQQILDRVREDISLHLWRYLGTLGRRNAMRRGRVYVNSEEIARGMQGRLGLSDSQIEFTHKLVEEFHYWLIEDCNGFFQAPWGKIQARTYNEHKQFEVSTGAIDSPKIGLELEDDRADAVCNYFDVSDEDLIRLLAEAQDEG